MYWQGINLNNEAKIREKMLFRHFTHVSLFDKRAVFVLLLAVYICVVYGMWRLHKLCELTVHLYRCNNLDYMLMVGVVNRWWGEFNCCWLVVARL